MTAPPLTVPDVDVDRFGKLLLKVEAHAHRYGWDKPVHMRVIYDETANGGLTGQWFRQIRPPEPMYAPVRHEGYVAATFFNHRVLYVPWEKIPAEYRDPNSTQPGPGPWETLRTLALNAAYGEGSDDVDTMRGILRQPGLLGFATVGEAWHNNGEVVRRAVRGEVHLGDVPDSIETRVIYSVDLPGRIQHVQRVRGCKPERVDLDDDADLRGDFTTSMRIFRDVVLDTVPPSPEDFQQRYPTLLEIMESRCSDPADPDGCPQGHHHHDPLQFILVDSVWRRSPQVFP